MRSVGFGEYRIEYYGSDGELINTDVSGSLTEAMDKADIEVAEVGSVDSYMVMRCVLDSLDGGLVRK